MCKIDVFLKKNSSLPQDIDQTNLVYSNDDQGRVYQNCNFHDPPSKGSCARAWPNMSMEMQFSHKNHLLYFQALIKGIKYIVTMTKKGSTKIVNFMTPGAGVFVLGRGHISHLVKMHYFFKNHLLYFQALIRQLSI